jgi:hypothetical protein
MGQADLPGSKMVPAGCAMRGVQSHFAFANASNAISP